MFVILVVWFVWERLMNNIPRPDTLWVNKRLVIAYWQCFPSLTENWLHCLRWWRTSQPSLSSQPRTPLAMKKNLTAHRRIILGWSRNILSLSKQLSSCLLSPAPCLYCTSSGPCIALQAAQSHIVWQIAVNLVVLKLVFLVWFNNTYEIQ